MKRKDSVISLGETMRLTFRAMGDMNRFSPGFVPSLLLDGAFSAASPFVTLYLSALLINELAGPRCPDVIWRLIAITVSVTAVLALIGFLLERWTKAWQAKFDMQHRQYLSGKMLDLDYADADKQSTRDLYNRYWAACSWNGYGYYVLIAGIQYAAKALGGISSAVALTVSLFTEKVPQSGGVLTVLNNPLFILAFVLLVALISVFSSLSYALMRRKETTANELAMQENRDYGFFVNFGLSDGTHRSMDIRMYNQQHVAQHGFLRGKMFSMHGIMGKLCWTYPGILLAVSGACGAILTGAAYVFVCLKAYGGAFGIGSVTQYVSALTALIGSFRLLSKSVECLRDNAPYLRILFEYLDIPNSMYQGSLPTEKRNDREYDVEFKNVSFKYPGSDIWALRHVNMKFKVGQRLAIVGENGSGKTTFIKLLCRLYDPQEGQILLNGIDIRKYNYRDYMDVFSIVFQDFQLISQPLGNNVAGASEYDEDRARKALVDAGFGDRLESLPDGLDTQLYKDFGIDGIEVSGGEAQKIAIARALYKDAPFIILDEPTAALDPIAEAEIYAKFNDISGDKTAIYISHRLSSCKFCDEIAVFHEGAVIQQGTHDALLTDETGKYYALWNAQAQYYTEKTV